MWRDRLLQALVVVGVGLLALAAFLVWRQANLQAAGLGPAVTVWVAARDLQPDTALQESHLSARTVPRVFLLPGAVTDRNAALGRVVTVPVAAGQPMMEYILTDPDLGDAQLRRFDLHERGNVTLPMVLAPGDRVDILVAGQRGDGDPVAWVLAESVRVLNMSGTKERTVAVALTLEHSQELMYHLQFAKAVRLLRRNPGGGME